jgi:hypothetical protein
VLYAATATTTLFGYDDHFANTTVVPINPPDGGTIGVDPATGKADTFTVILEPVGSGIGAGNRIDIRIRKKGEAWGAASKIYNVSVTATSPSRIVVAPTDWPGLPNTEYEWHARFDQAVSGDVVRTPWCAVQTLKVAGGTIIQQPHAGPILLSPQGGATTGLTPGISWAPFSGATKYQVILATDSELKNRVAGTPVFVTAPSWQPTEPLEYDTSYFAAVTAVEPTVSPQSVISFTTREKPAPPPPAPAPPVVVKEVPAPVINIPPAPAPAPVQQITPAFIWAIVIIGAILVIAVIVLIVRTRRPM